MPKDRRVVKGRLLKNPNNSIWYSDGIHKCCICGQPAKRLFEISYIKNRKRVSILACFDFEKSCFQKALSRAIRESRDKDKDAIYAREIECLCGGL